MFALLSFWTLLMVLVGPAQAAEPVGPGPEVAFGKGPDTSALTQGHDQKQQEQSAAEAEAEKKRKEKLARVIVLKWINTSTDNTDITVQRNVKSRIARPDALFFRKWTFIRMAGKCRIARWCRPCSPRSCRLRMWPGYGRRWIPFPVFLGMP